jgi:hypothetical protein
MKSVPEKRVGRKGRTEARVWLPRSRVRSGWGRDWEEQDEGLRPLRKEAETRPGEIRSERNAESGTNLLGRLAPGP